MGACKWDTKTDTLDVSSSTANDNIPEEHQNKADSLSQAERKPLTERELEILRWLSQGKSSWDISKILDISERTVKFHVNNACVKLDAVNRTHAVAKAILHDLISVDMQNPVH